MPELPEVEVICRGLQPHLIGKKIVQIKSSGKNLRVAIPLESMQQSLCEARVIGLRRRAKYLIFSFDSGDTLIFHLGMTGKLTICPKQTPALPHDHLTFQLDSGCELRFNDIRRFGSVTLLDKTASANMEESFFKRCGPEPFSESCTADYLYRRARRCHQPVKAFLMNGEVIAGIGNIYANESLFASRIHPSTPTCDLTREQWQKLLSGIREILTWAIACGGSTISDFQNASGQQGYFQANFKVYGKKGQPCVTCSTPIEKETISGRSSFWCPLCQKR